MTALNLCIGYPTGLAQSRMDTANNSNAIISVDADSQGLTETVHLGGDRTDSIDRMSSMCYSRHKCRYGSGSSWTIQVDGLHEKI